jgi:thiosulfate reductase cytochrome b subunit
MKRLEYKHRLVSRWTHWFNFPVLGVMIWSGLLIYWASDVYRIGFDDFTAFHFFPDWVYKAFRFDHGLAEGMSIHFFFMWLFALNGVAYVLYTVFSGEWRDMVPNRHSLRDAIDVTLHDLGFTKELPPQTKYNGAQRFAYTSIIVMGFGSLITGLAIYRPIQLSWLTALIGGYTWARFFHFWLMMGFLGFFAIHIAQVIRAGWNNFRSMVAGYELVRDARAVEDEGVGQHE